MLYIYIHNIIYIYMIYIYMYIIHTHTHIHTRTHTQTPHFKTTSWPWMVVDSSVVLPPAWVRVENWFSCTHAETQMQMLALMLTKRHNNNINNKPWPVVCSWGKVPARVILQHTDTVINTSQNHSGRNYYHMQRLSLSRVVSAAQANLGRLRRCTCWCLSYAHTHTFIHTHTYTKNVHAPPPSPTSINNQPSTTPAATQPLTVKPVYVPIPVTYKAIQWKRQWRSN